MTAFVVVATLLALGALAFLLPPLFAGADATQASPPERALGAAGALALPLAAALLYVAAGTPAALRAPTALQADGPSAHAVSPERIQAMVTQLVARLRERPEDVEGWAMLARSYTVLGRFADAAIAFERAVEREPGNAQLLADFADVAAMAQGRKLQGRPEALALRALEADPRHAKALSLAGTAAFERGDYAKAATYWQRALAVLPADSPAARAMRGSIADAERKGGVAATIEGRVTLARALAAKVRPDDTVFVYARAAEGPRMPLAMQRIRAADLPYAFRLDDSMAMDPQRRLSSAARVVVTARLSRAGSATPAPGDFEGSSAPVGARASGVEIEIAAPVVR